MRIFKDPKDAIGHKIQYYTWNNVYFILEDVDLLKKKVIGTLVDKKNEYMTGVKYNLCNGITKGEKRYDYWHCIDYNKYKLDDELFEI